MNHNETHMNQTPFDAPYQGKRKDQVEFSCVVIATCAIIGSAVGMYCAIGSFIHWLTPIAKTYVNNL